jgi:GxxExxY protein
MTTLTTSRVNSDFLHSGITDRIIACYYGTYDELGYGFLESNYANGLTMFLREAGLFVEREVPVEVLCRGQPVGFYRLDMIVERCVVVELKASVSIGIADERQLQNYLKATQLEVGLLLHFGPQPKVRRMVFSNSRKPQNRNP